MGHWCWHPPLGHHHRDPSIACAWVQRRRCHPHGNNDRELYYILDGRNWPGVGKDFISDVDEDASDTYQRPPTHAQNWWGTQSACRRISATTNPIWGLEDRAFTGQFHSQRRMSFLAPFLWRWPSTKPRLEPDSVILCRRSSCYLRSVEPETTCHHGSERAHSGSVIG